MKTRILNISPRAQLNIDDDATGEYPTLLRTGDDRVLGNDKIAFDDSKTQIFSSRTVLMPYNISRSQASSSGFLTGSIEISKTPHPSTQFLTTFTDESYVPFDECRNPAAFFSQTDISGTSTDVYPGFSSPITSKVMIQIDITPATSKISYKMDPSYATNASYQHGTGFMYFNFERKMWEDIGLVEPGTGNSTNYKISIDLDPDLKAIPSSLEKQVGQFTPSPGVAISTMLSSVKDLLDLGYGKIGTPTAFFDAPRAPRYHATSSQALKMSDYIQHPFVLEKVYVEMPVIGSRTQDAGPTAIKPGAYRDITNHVFFIYRQNRANASVDSITDVSSSIRTLIANESFCFYNSSSIYAGNEPLHEPAVQINHNQPLNIASTTVRGASLKLLFNPKIYDQMQTAVSQYPSEILPGRANPGRPLGLSHYWLGGTKIPIASGTLNTFSTTTANDIVNFNTLAYPGVGVTLNNPSLHPENFIGSKKYIFDARSLHSSTWRGTSGPRSLAQNSFFTGTSIGGIFRYDVGATSVSTDPSLKLQSGGDTFSRSTPYLLLPSDELIFGIDSGFHTIISASLGASTPNFVSSHDMAGANLSAASMTGSILTIPAQPAKVCLYGSLILNNAEKLPTLNQRLTSNALHEAIQDEITDQFDVSERLLYSGSYLDNYITGSLITQGQRGVVGRDSSGNTYPYFIMNRFSSQTCFSEIQIGSDRSYPATSFRANHFGFNRDMLEQRHDSKRYDNNFIQKSTGQLNFNKITSTTLTASPTSCIFVSQSSDTVVVASSTRSSNLSTEFTCSLPFFDNTSRNRSSITFNNNPPFTPGTIILNKPSSLLSST